MDSLINLLKEDHMSHKKTTIRHTAIPATIDNINYCIFSDQTKHKEGTEKAR